MSGRKAKKSNQRKDEFYFRFYKKDFCRIEQNFLRFDSNRDFLCRTSIDQRNVGKFLLFSSEIRIVFFCLRSETIRKKSRTKTNRTEKPTKTCAKLFSSSEISFFPRFAFFRETRSGKTSPFDESSFLFLKFLR